MSKEATLTNIYQSAGLREERDRVVAHSLLLQAGISESRPGRIDGRDRERALEILRLGLVRVCADPTCAKTLLPAGRQAISAPTSECEICLGGTNHQAAEILQALGAHGQAMAELDEPALLATVADEIGLEEVGLGELARRLRSKGVDVRAAGLRALAERSGALALRGERIRRLVEIDLASALTRLNDLAAITAPLAIMEAAAEMAVEAATPESTDMALTTPPLEPAAEAPVTAPEQTTGAPNTPPALEGLALENERIGRFAALFGALERELRHRLLVDDEMRLGDLVRAAADADPLVRSWQRVLADAVRFRNPLMHRSVRGRPLAIPTEAFLAELALAVRSLTSEGRLIDLAERPVRLALGAQAHEVVRAFEGSPAVLVETENGTVLISAASFARWVARTTIAAPGRPLLFTAESAATLAERAAARTVTISIAARPAAAILAMRSPNCEALLLANELGEVLAVVLPSGLPALLASIGEDPSGPAIPVAGVPSGDEE